MLQQRSPIEDMNVNLFLETNESNVYITTVDHLT